MEYYYVYFGKEQVGGVQVVRQGLYYRFICRCNLNGGTICRLQVTCGDSRENLGIVVPMDGAFGLETKLPVKRLGEGKMEFLLLPKHEVLTEHFIPISPEEPFSYIARLKDTYLVKRNGQRGVLLDL